MNFSVIAFPDHHRFSKGDWEFIVETARKEGANHFFTTAKDWHRENFETIPESVREKLKVLMLEHGVENNSVRNLAAYVDVK